MKTAKNLGDMKNYSIYMLNGKMGLAGTPNGENEQVIITQPKYDIIYPFVKEHAIVKAGEFFGVINKYGVETIPANRYKYILPDWGEGVFHVSDGHWGDEHCLDAYNNVVINDKPKQNDFAREKREVARFAHLDISAISSFYLIGGLYFYKYEDKEYIYNPKLKKVLFKGKSCWPIGNDKIMVIDEYTNKKGIIDDNGRIIARFEYDDLFYCERNETYISDGLIEALKEGKSGYIDYNGNIKIPFIYKYCGRFENGFAWVSDENDKCGLIDKYGNIVEPLVHYYIDFLSDGKIIYCDSDIRERYYIKGKPKDYVKQDWRHESFVFEVLHNPNYVGVKTRDRKQGITYIDGRIMIPAEYDDFAFFQTINNNGIIVVKNGKYGIIDMNNNTLLPFDFDYIYDIKVEVNNQKFVYYIVNKGGMSSVIRNDFRECIPMMYKRIKYSKIYKCFIVEVNTDYAMVDFCNNIVIPFSSNQLDTHDSYLRRT